MSTTDELWFIQRDKLRVRTGYFTTISLPPEAMKAAQDEFLHVAHTAHDSPAMVAYVLNTDKQAADVWVRTKIGRYLAKYHPELSNEQVKAAVVEFEYEHGAPPEVKFGETEADFIHAIKDGPSDSCMADRFYDTQGSAFKFKGHIHPAAVYAAGDILVAWLEKGADVTARALINKSTKAVSRVYGDSDRLLPQLLAAGFEQKSGALVGCRLEMIENKHGDGHIMAYVDAGIASGGGCLDVREVAGYWLLERSSRDQQGRTYAGYGDRGVMCDEDEDEGADEYICDRCGDRMGEDEGTFIEAEQRSVCDNCLDRHYVYAQTSTRRNYADEYVPDHDARFVECLDRNVHNDILGELDIVMDDERGEYINVEDSVECVLSEDDRYHCDDCVECGEDGDGQMYIHEGDVKREMSAGHLYKLVNPDSSDRNLIFWHLCDEVADEGLEEGEVSKYVMCVPPNTDQHVLELSGEMVEVPVVRQEMIHPPPLTPPLTPPDNTWKQHYLKMQERGVGFTGSGCTGRDWSFNHTRGQRMYQIDPAKPEPGDWKAIYREAQAAGVVFRCVDVYTGGEVRGPLLFDGQFSSYSLKI